MKRALLTISLLLVLSLACSFSDLWGTGQDPNVAATAVAATVQAAQVGTGGQPVMPSPQVFLQPTSQGASVAEPTAIPSRLPPTAIPTRLPPTAIPTQPAGAPAPQKLSILNIILYPSDIAYFGNCQAGELTLLNVQATIDPLNQVKSATLYYNLVNFSGRPQSFSTQMWQLGIGDYAGDIDLARDAPGHLGDKDGMVEFWIEAIDKSGLTVRSKTYNLPVYYCIGAALGPPPVANEQEITLYVADQYSGSASTDGRTNQGYYPGDDANNESWWVFLSYLLEIPASATITSAQLNLPCTVAFDKPFSGLESLDVYYYYYGNFPPGARLPIPTEYLGSLNACPGSIDVTASLQNHLSIAYYQIIAAFRQYTDLDGTGDGLEITTPTLKVKYIP